MSRSGSCGFKIETELSAAQLLLCVFYHTVFKDLRGKKYGKLGSSSVSDSLNTLQNCQ